MNNTSCLFGIRKIRVKAFEIDKNDTRKINEFLAQHDGKILNIEILPLLYGVSRWIITYQADPGEEEEYEREDEEEETFWERK